jgi:alpha-galactosidase
MAATKIVIIGAGGAGIALDTLCDLTAHRGVLAGSTIGLVDVDGGRLEQAQRLGERLSQASGAGFRFVASTDRRQVLPGASFVIIAIEVNRLALWQLDWEIPRRHGVRHIMGENGGPGGLSHALRTIPIVLDICRDIEALCPDALLMVFTNPLSRVCLAISRYTKLRCVGLCHQVGAGIANIARVLDMAPEDLDLTAAGINHFTWALSIRRLADGQDLYPQFRERLSAWPASFEPLSRRLLSTFGLYPATGDDHLGEDVSFAWETDELAAHTDRPDLPATFLGQKGTREQAALVIQEALNDDDVLADLLDHRSGERIVPTICAVLENMHQYEIAVNTVNNGCIANLPDWAVVEAPALVSAEGVKPVVVGSLPEGCAAVLAQRIAIHSLTVEAAVHGDRQAALQALLLDPVVPGYEAAVATLDDLLQAHAAHLPQFRSHNRD